MKNLSPQRISKLSQVELMRNIYNSTLADLATKPLKYKTYDEQIAWWNNLDKDRVRAWLMFDGSEHRLIGFVMLTDRGTFETPMFSILPEEQGKGWGRKFIEFYLDRANGPLAGEQLYNNKRIKHLNDEMGWTIEKSGPEVELLYHRGTKPISPAEEIRIYHDVLQYHGLLNKEHKL